MPSTPIRCTTRRSHGRHPDPDRRVNKTIFLQRRGQAQRRQPDSDQHRARERRKQVYIPIYRTQGASTLNVVDHLQRRLPDMKDRLTTPDVELKLVMDQSIYVRKAIESLAEEGMLGAILCSLVILVFLGEWRMTLIAVMTIPVAVLAPSPVCRPRAND